MKPARRSDTLQAFLAAALRRMWMVALVEAWRTALWAGAALLLVLAGVHTAVTPVPYSLLWLAIAMAISGALLRVAIRRPILNKSTAAVIDRRFGARALISTAVECLQHSPGRSGEASRIVLSQASDAAHGWQQALPRTIVPSQRIASSIALIPLFVAILLLLQPGAKPAGNPIPTSRAPAAAEDPSTQSPIADRDTSTKTFADLRRELDHSSERPSGLADKAATNTTTTRKDKSSGEGDGGAAAISAGGTGDDAGNATASKTDIAMLAAGRLEQTALLPLQRTGKTTATTIATGHGYDSESLKTSFLPVNVLPAAPPESGHDRSTLNAAQAAYAMRYLSAAGTNDE